MMMVVTDATQPAFLVTIDTEGDNLWSKPRRITTNNARYLPRFQQLCERYGLRPTWLTDYEMACCPIFREFARNVIDMGKGEIGAHLHAWHSPPEYCLTDDDYRNQPFLIEYPEPVMYEKVSYLTKLLEDTFQVSVSSHRAGRWAMDDRYAGILARLRYRVDCSVTPGLRWRRSGSCASGIECDYCHAPQHPYAWPKIADTSGTLWELPMTVRKAARGRLWRLCAGVVRAVKVCFAERMLNYWKPAVNWLRPNGRNRLQMLELLRQLLEEQAPYAMFMLHSSELMAGGSPRFRTPRAIEKLYEDLELLFEFVSDNFVGMTVSEFTTKWFATARPASSCRGECER